VAEAVAVAQAQGACQHRRAARAAAGERRQFRGEPPRAGSASIGTCSIKAPAAVAFAWKAGTVLEHARRSQRSPPER